VNRSPNHPDLHPAIADPHGLGDLDELLRRRRRRSRRLRRGSAAAAAVAVAALLAACGDDDASTRAADTSTPVAPATSEAPAHHSAAAHSTPGSEPTEPGRIEVLLGDYHFGGLPDEVAAGTEIAVENESTGEVHELVAMRLPDGDERPVDEILAGGMDELMGLGMPALVIVAAPGGADPVVAVGDGRLHEPGRYLIVCTIPTGADPDEFMAAMQSSGDAPPEVAGGAPHFANGMVDDLVVTA